jgi:hypothetical protein
MSVGSAPEGHQKLTQPRYRVENGTFSSYWCWYQCLKCWGCICVEQATFTAADGSSPRFWPSCQTIRQGIIVYFVVRRTRLLSASVKYTARSLRPTNCNGSFPPSVARDWASFSQDLLTFNILIDCKRWNQFISDP